MWKRMVLSMLLACLPWSFCHGESPVPEDMGNLEKAGAVLEKQEEKVPWFEIHGDYRQDGFHCPRRSVVKDFGTARDHGVAAPFPWVCRPARVGAANSVDLKNETC